MTFVAIAATKAASATLDSCVCIKKHWIVEFTEIFWKNIPINGMGMRFLQIRVSQKENVNKIQGQRIV